MFFPDQISQAIWDDKATVTPMPKKIADRVTQIIDKLPLGCSDEDWSKYSETLSNIKVGCDASMQAHFMTIDQHFEKLNSPATTGPDATQIQLMQFLTAQQKILEGLSVKFDQMQGNDDDDDDDEEGMKEGPRKVIRKGTKAKALPKRRSSG